MDIKNIKDSLVRGKVFGGLRVIENLEKENTELKAQITELKNMASKQVDAILKLYDQIEKMKFDIKVEADRNAYISQATLNHLLEQWELAE